MSKVSNLTSGLPTYSLEGFETDLLSDSCQDIIAVIEESPGDHAREAAVSSTTC